MTGVNDRGTVPGHAASEREWRVRWVGVQGREENSRVESREGQRMRERIEGVDCLWERGMQSVRHVLYKLEPVSWIVKYVQQGSEE